MHLYEHVGDGTYDPTEYTRGPWRSDAQHGGPPSALLGRLVEAELADGHRIGRINVELVRPVPIEMLETEVDSEVVSRRVSRIRARLICNGQLVARATAMALQESQHGFSLDAPSEANHTLPAESETVRAPIWMVGENEMTYHRDALEHRFVEGGFGDVGRSDGWHRMVPALVQGENTSPLCKVLGVADLASGVSSIYAEQSGVGLINADLDVTIVRPLAGEWVHLEATTHTDGTGTGVCVSTMGDTEGPAASGTQCLLGVRFD